MKEISSTVTFPYMYIQICVTRCIFAHQNPNDNSFNVLTYCEHRRRNNTSTHYEIKIFKKLKIIHRVFQEYLHEPISTIEISETYAAIFSVIGRAWPSLEGEL